MKIVYVNCGWNMSEIWSSQHAIHLSSWKSNLKKIIEPWTGFEPMTFRNPWNALSTELPSHMDRWSIVSSWYTQWQWIIWIWIFENHICEMRIVYHEHTIDHPSMWLGSSVDRALHRYRKVMGSNPVQAWIFFRLLFQLLKLIARCEDQISLMFHPHPTEDGLSRTHNWPSIHVAW